MRLYLFLKDRWELWAVGVEGVTFFSGMATEKLPLLQEIGPTHTPADNQFNSVGHKRRQESRRSIC